MSNLNTILNRKKVGERTFNNLLDKVGQDKKIVKEPNYKTKGEILLVIKDVVKCNLTLDSETTEHIIIKALTQVIIKPSKNYIDEFYSEIEINKGACVEFFLLDGNWYIVSSDGLKLE